MFLILLCVQALHHAAKEAFENVLISFEQATKTSHQSKAVISFMDDSKTPCVDG